MNKSQFQKELQKACRNGTLMTPKHNPSNLSVTYTSYRTVLSHELAQDLDNFISSGDYDVIQYQDNNPSHSPDYYEVIPTGASFSVPASGVAAQSPSATGLCDRLVAVCSPKQGWHLFGEEASNISQKVKTGTLTSKGQLS